MTKEVWKRVPGEPLLWASNLGRVKSDPYQVQMPKGGTRTCQLKPTRGRISKADKLGNYWRMHVDFRGKTYKVHRLVCAAFKGPPPHKRPKDSLVLHLDDDGLNNRESNLKWGSQYENLNSGRFRDLMAERAAARDRAHNGQFA